MYIFPYNKFSETARDLSRELGVPRIKREGSRFRGRPNKTVINWGCSSIDNPEVDKCRIINHPHNVRLVSNKLRFFEVDARRNEEGRGYELPEYCTSMVQAREWIEGGGTVVCRTSLDGNSGHGIVIASTVDDLVDAPLYTKYIKKKDEYRIHVMGGQVIDMQRKALKLGYENPDWHVRSHERGFVFSRQNCDPPQAVLDSAINAVRAYDLDFGGVDVIWNNHHQKAYVLEINSAPGLENSTLRNYASKIRELYN